MIDRFCEMCTYLNSTMWHRAEEVSRVSPNKVRVVAPLFVTASVALDVFAGIADSWKNCLNKSCNSRILIGLNFCYKAVVEPVLIITAGVVDELYGVIMTEIYPRKYAMDNDAVYRGYYFRKAQENAFVEIVPDKKERKHAYVLLEMSRHRFSEAIWKANTQKELDSLHFLDTPESIEALFNEIKVKAPILIRTEKAYKAAKMIFSKKLEGSRSDYIKRLQADADKSSEPSTRIFSSKIELKDSYEECLGAIIRASIDEAKSICFVPKFKSPFDS